MDNTMLGFDRNALLFRFLRDVVQKLRKQFFALAILSAFCAVTDGFRILVAFLLLPFVGVPLDATGPSFLKTAKEWIELSGIPYELGPIAAIVITAFAIQALLTLLQSWYQGSYTHLYTLKWRQQLFRALGRARWGYFLNTSRGELVNALSQETSRLSSATAKFLVFMSNLLVALAYVIASFLVSFEATLVMTAVGVSVVVFNSLVLKRLMRHARAIVKGNNQMMTVAQEFLSNAKAVKASPMGLSVESLVAQPLATIFKSERIGYMLPNASRIAAEMFVMLALVIGIATAGAMSPGGSSSDSLLVLVLFMRAYSKITMTMTAAQQMYVQLPAFEYVDRIYKQATDQEEPLWQEGEAIAGERFDSGLVFENVTVLHGDHTALKEVSVRLPPRSVVALVGASGAGKTTFVDTLLRLVDVCSGRITVAGRDVREFNIQSWRACFGYVSQELTLINGTLADNIKFFKPQATDLEVSRAAQLAHAHEFIARLPLGYDTPVGELGLKLSGGQRQRIAVARALINDPPVLIFDEATSALDSESEEKVMQAVSEMAAGKIVILIAHRLSTVRNADLILVLEQGQLIEQGRWDDLVKADGRFSELWVTLLRGRGESRQQESDRVQLGN